MKNKVQTEQCLKELFSDLRSWQFAPAFLEALPDTLAWIRDLDGYFLWASEAFLEQYKYIKDGVLGKNVHELFPKHIADDFRADDREVVRKKEAILHRVRVVTNQHGGVEWKEVSRFPLFDQHDKVVGTLGIMRRMGFTDGYPVPSQDSLTAAIVGVIYNYIDKNLKVAELADEARVSVSTLEKLFKEHMGTTPKKFMMRAKAAVACELLLNTELDVKDVGESLGYFDHANFTRSFGNLVGMSPTQYRKSLPKNQPSA